MQRVDLGDLGFDTVRWDTPKGSPSLVGVWTPDGRKLASIGMRIRGSVTSHGFALNLGQAPMPTEATVRDAIFRRLRKQP